MNPTHSSQEGESTKDCIPDAASRLTCIGSSSTMLIIPSPLDAKWKPSDRRTLVTERQSGKEDFTTCTASLKYKNDSTPDSITPPFPREGFAHRECGKVALCTGQPEWSSAQSRHSNTPCPFVCLPGHSFSSAADAELGKALAQVALEAVCRTKTLCLRSAPQDPRESIFIEVHNLLCECGKELGYSCNRHGWCQPRLDAPYPTLVVEVAGQRGQGGRGSTIGHHSERAGHRRMLQVENEGSSIVRRQLLIPGRNKSSAC